MFAVPASDCRRQELLQGTRFRDIEFSSNNSSEPLSVRKRGAALTIASVLTVLNGLAGAVVGLLLILLGLLGSRTQVSQLSSSPPTKSNMQS